MKILRNCFFQNFLLVVLLLMFGLFCSKGLFKEYAFATHDGDHHISRSFDAIKSLKEGYFPLRWAGSLNGWCGVPVFNFFYPLIYYLVFLINFLVKDVIVSLKIIASLSFVVAPVFFYFWLNRETKNKIASFVGAFLYLFVPYRFLLVFVRFSPEFLAYTILPIVLWLLVVLMNNLKKEKYISFRILLIAFLLSIAGGLFVISHNFAVMLIFPILVLYVILKIWTLKIFTKEKISLLIFIFISFLGIGSFFLGPMMLEKKNVKLDTLRTVDYRDHFPTLKQLVRSKWDYGNSLPGTEKDGMSFMLGYSQWLVLGSSLIFLSLLVLKKKRIVSDNNLQIIFWFILSNLSLFMILPWSQFIWDRIKILQDIQFSWRLLGVTSFTMAALAGFLLSGIKNKKIFYFLSFIFLVFAFYGNRNHLRIQPTPYPQKYIDYEKNHDHRYATTSIFDDILNKESKSLCLPVKNMSSDLSISFVPSSGKTNLVTERGNTFGKVLIELSKDFQGSLRLSLEYFPGIYKIKVNGEEVYGLKNCEGRVCLENINLKSGENILEWKIVQNNTEKIFNLISILFILLWIFILIVKALILKKVNSEKVILLFILFFAAVFRVCRLGDLLGFWYDQGRDALVIWDFIHYGKFFLIGPVTGIEGIFLGPFFYYLLAPFYWLGGGNPVFPAFFLSLLSVGTTFLIYFLGKKIYGKQVGLLAAFLYGFSYQEILFSRWLANPNPLPFFTLLALLCLYKFIETRNSLFIIPCSFLLGLCLQLEAAAATFFLPTVLIFVLWQRKAIKNAKGLVLSLLAFLVTFLPQIYFNFRHQGILATSLKTFLISEKSFSGGKGLGEIWFNILKLRLLLYFDTFFVKQFLLSHMLALVILALFSATFFGFRKKILTLGGKFLTLWVIVPLIGYYFYRGNHGYVWGYYLSGLIPAFIILFSAGLWLIGQKYFLGKILVGLFLIFFLINNTIALESYLRTGVGITLGAEKKAIDWIYQEAGKEEFNVDVYVPPQIDYSYSYLFRWYGKEKFQREPETKLVKTLFTLSEPDGEHPQFLRAWLERQEGIGKIEKIYFWENITVQKRERVKYE